VEADVWRHANDHGLAAQRAKTPGAVLTVLQGATVLDNLTDAYRVASHAWLARLVPVARGTFTVLAGIEVAVSGIIYGFRRQALDDVAARFVLKFALLAFLLAVVTNVTAWLPPIVGGFAAAGETAIGATGTVNPSDIVDIGVAIAGRLLTALDVVGVLAHPATAVFAAISALIVIVAYVLVAAQLVLALVESYVVLTAGVVFLGFAACRATAGIADGFLTHVVRLGVRIFLLYLIVSLGSELSRGWVATISADQLFGPASPIGQVLAGAIIFALLAVRIPDELSNRIASRQSFGLARALASL
jgi:type IV secretion system protein TrbL